MKTDCAWCGAFVKVPSVFNPRKHFVYCNRGCRDSDMLFALFFSDEQINRRNHYDILTEGEDDEQEG